MNWMDIAHCVAEDGDGFLLQNSYITFCARCGLHEEGGEGKGFNKLASINWAFKPQIPRHHHRAIEEAVYELYAGYWLCTGCVSDLMPSAMRLYESSLINTELNKLKEAINERKRTENGGSIASSFGQHRKGRTQQGLGR